MAMDKKFKDFLLHGDQTFLPHISVDCVIFGFQSSQLKVLLLKWKERGQWSLPGGFVRHNESIDASAERTLKERTGLSDLYLRQFHAFGDPRRDSNKPFIKRHQVKKSWMANRFVTVGYYSLVDYSKVSPQPDWLSESCEWFGVNAVPKLIFDHNDIIKKALDVLRFSLNDIPVGYNLLPEKFTMPELQNLYETILDVELDRRNFQKKMLSFGLLERLNERKTGGAHKSPFLYRFDKRKYDKAMKQGLTFAI
jgi:ADP-ribose pyrophosphatase YjhB (NUDIX family)